jgi:hypothetical protein
VSVADGGLYGLDEPKQSWEKGGQATPRVAHRIISDGRRILGAYKGKDSDLVEVVEIGK